MGYKDSNLQFSNAQALSGVGSTDASFYFDDTASQGALSGIGEPMDVEIFVTTAPGGTTPTITATLYAADDSGFTTNVQTLGQVTIPATAVVGDKFYIPIPANDDQAAGQGVQTNRYYKVSYTLGGTLPTISVSAYLTPRKLEQQNNIFSTSGFTIK